MSTLTVQNIQGSASSSNTINVASGHKISGAAGSIVAPGQVLQVQNTTNSASATTTSQMAADDSIPQSSEGLEVMTCSITPKSASSKLLIQVVVYGSDSGDAVMTIALFQDSGANALAAVTAYQSTGTGTQTLSFNHFMTAGTTSSTTFKVRAAGNSGTFTLNGYSGGRKLGGVASSSITIMEIAQ